MNAEHVRANDQGSPPNPAPVPPPVTRPQRKTTLRIPDIREVAVKTESTTDSPAPEAASTAFSVDELRVCWNEFAETRKGMPAEYQLLQQAIECRGHAVHITLTNPVQLTLLDSLKRDLITHLRRALKNDLIQVVGTVTEPDIATFVYSSEEKFEFLAKKNPALKELKKRLGLDHDF